MVLTPPRGAPDLGIVERAPGKAEELRSGGLGGRRGKRREDEASKNQAARPRTACPLRCIPRKWPRVSLVSPRGLLPPGGIGLTERLPRAVPRGADLGRLPPEQ